jgi:hypothetical protein
MIRKNKNALIILLGIDILLSSVYILTGNSGPNSESELLVIPFALVINIVLALILAILRIVRLLKYNVYKVFLLNAVIACIVYILLDFSWSYYQQKINYKTMTFKVANQDYELVLTYRDTSYYIDKIWPGTAQPVMSGKYQMKDGRIEFNNNNFIIEQDSLSGFVENRKLKLISE